MRQDMKRLLLSFRGWQVLWKEENKVTFQKATGKKIVEITLKKNDQRVRRIFWEGEIWAEIWNARRSQSREDSRVRHSRLSALGSGWAYLGLRNWKRAHVAGVWEWRGQWWRRIQKGRQLWDHIKQQFSTLAAKIQSRKYSCPGPHLLTLLQLVRGELGHQYV